MCTPPSPPRSSQALGCHGNGSPSTCHRVVDHASAEKVIERSRERECVRERKRGKGNTKLCLTRPLIAQRHTPDHHCLPWIHTNTHTSLPAQGQTTLHLCSRIFVCPLCCLDFSANPPHSLCLSNSVLLLLISSPLHRSRRRSMNGCDSYLRLSMHAVSLQVKKKEKKRSLGHMLRRRGDKQSVVGGGGGRESWRCSVSLSSFTEMEQYILRAQSTKKEREHSWWEKAGRAEEANVNTEEKMCLCLFPGDKISSSLSFPPPLYVCSAALPFCLLPTSSPAARLPTRLFSTASGAPSFPPLSALMCHVRTQPPLLSC